LLLIGAANNVLAIFSIARIVTYPLVGQRLANFYSDIQQKLQSQISQNHAAFLSFKSRNHHALQRRPKMTGLVNILSAGVVG
jgi:hypothetical protein